MEWFGLVFFLYSASGHLSLVSSASNSLYGSSDLIPVKGRGPNPAQEHEGPQPYFDVDFQRNVTAISTQTAFLHCRVKDLGGKAVSWIRQRELNGIIRPVILTTGLFTYTSDQRFSVLQRAVSEYSPTDETLTEWVLQIKFVQPRDSGIYECQVSTEPRISENFYLNVVESKAKMIGSSDMYVKQGSTLSLTCLVTQAIEHATIFWYHDLSVIDDSQVVVRIDQHFDSSISTLTSRLRISNLQPIHSGNYTCLTTAADPASTMVHVINGEHPAAMQHGNTGISLLLQDSSCWIPIVSRIFIELFVSVLSYNYYR
ncbi:zwei Ig domain protein zig-8-like [Daphnia carinata]|uniref:zwei Ig domain protein zig-8-like n=1 Tax=Daphnia carinata TaxID=120202 RepID=UPI00257DAADE|nr:zwei Ig domain protein zig-8-like [Daphnia carinata]